MSLTAAASASVALACAIQAALALRVYARMARTARGVRIQPSDAPDTGRVAVIVPVIDEAARIDGCLERLCALGEEVRQILVVDGGSRDATAARVAAWAQRDARVECVDAAPIPPHWTGKAWGLEVGLRHVALDCDWVLTIDADVRTGPRLVRSLLAHARATGVEAFSVATAQRVRSSLQAALHASFLGTLVVRFGIPGHAVRDPARVQANGQCFLARRERLVATGAFVAARDSLCEDVTAARHLARCGVAVGFYEADASLAEVTMYESAAELWRSWPRSLPLRDRLAGRSAAIGLAEVVAVQGLPLPLFAVALAAGADAAAALQLGLLAGRLGVLAGTARAYVRRRPGHWLAPLADPLVAARLVQSALRRRHRWRGRTYRRIAAGAFSATEQP